MEKLLPPHIRSNYLRSLGSAVERANWFNLRRDFQLSKQTSRSRLLLTEMRELKRSVSHTRVGPLPCLEKTRVTGISS